MLGRPPAGSDARLLRCCSSSPKALFDIERSMLGRAGDSGAPSGSADALASPKTLFDIERSMLGRAGVAGVPSRSDAPASPKTFLDIERSRPGRGGGPGVDASLAESSATTTTRPFDIKTVTTRALRHEAPKREQRTQGCATCDGGIYP